MTTDRSRDTQDPQAADAPVEDLEVPDIEPGEVPQEAAVPGVEDAESLRERYLRLAAEYENFRKRTERERAESWNRAQAHLMERFLEPLDDLQRVSQFTGEKASAESLHEGVEMVERKLARLLEAAGLEEITAKGQPFDPAVHEALMTVPTEAAEEDHTVGEVLQRGYRFKGILLRPARVQVRSYEG